VFNSCRRAGRDGEFIARKRSQALEKASSRNGLSPRTGVSKVPRHGGLSAIPELAVLHGVI
jgi:hypothetical protein